MILLTGVTGKTGGAAANALIEKGVSIRALVRDADKAASLKEAGVELIIGDMADRDVVAGALDGVEKAALILPNSKEQRDMELQFTDLAAAAGVKHFVKLSSAFRQAVVARSEGRCQNPDSDVALGRRGAHSCFRYGLDDDSAELFHAEPAGCRRIDQE